MTWYFLFQTLRKKVQENIYQGYEKNCQCKSDYETQKCKNMNVSQNLFFALSFWNYSKYNWGRTDNKV